jgi:predicted PurR-regulated permease PerM
LVISPFVEGDQLSVHPLLVFISVLVGSSLLGPAGAFVSVPAAAMIQIVFNEVIVPWRSAQFDASAGEEAAAEAAQAVRARTEPRVG